FDEIRKKWVRLTPEEWVRQNFIQWLIQEMNYPASMMSVEKGIQLHELDKRYDLLVYDRTHQPWLLVECKAQTVPLTEKVLSQALRYSISKPVEYISITNGVDCLLVKKKESQLEKLTEFPSFPL
ncbi:MAG: type I restriction enzyme HsdR N-terminal domain-containing protein, partial [Chitinophagaceae bacterium]